MTRFIISRPVGTLMLCLGLTVMGAISMHFMPAALLPPIGIPVLKIHIEDPCLDASALETHRIGPLRKYLSATHGLKEINSVAHDSYGWVTLRFDFSEDLDLKFTEIREKLDIFYEERPVTPPRVVKANMNNLPMMMLNISCSENSGLDLTDIGDYCEQVLKRRLEQMDEVALADITGLPGRITEIIPDPSCLIQAGMSPGDLAGQLERMHDPVSIRVRNGNYRYTLTFSEPAPTPETLAGRIIRVREGRRVPLGELCRVRSVPTPGSYLYNGKPAVGIAILMSPDGNHNKLKKKILDLIENLKKEEPELQINISGNRSGHISNAISGLKNNLVMGVILAGMMILVSMSRIRPALLLLMSIPVSLLIALLAMKISGLGFNIITISGLIMAIGLMIDNAIIVTDNIEREIRFQRDIPSAVINGTEEVIRPLVSSQITTCIVFIPLVFLSDTAGAIFREQAIAIACGLLSSMLVSLCVIPNLAMLIYSRKEMTAGKPSVPAFIYKYEKLLIRSMKRPRGVLTVILSVIVAGALIFPVVPKRLYPDLPDRSRLIVIRGMEGARDRFIEQVLPEIRRLLHASDGFHCFIGLQDFICVEDVPSGSDEVYIYTDYPDDVMAENAARKLQRELNGLFPALKVEIRPVPHPFTRIFGGQADDPEARIYGPGPLEMPHPDTLKTLLLATGISGNVIDSELGVNTVIWLRKDKSLIHDVPLDAINKTLRANGPGLELRFPPYYEPVHPVLVRFDDREHLPVGKTIVMDDHGLPLSLEALAEKVDTVRYRTIKADRTGPYFSFPLEQPGETWMENFEWEAGKKGLLVQYDLPFFMDAGMLHQLILSLMISILLLYFILAIQFGSVIQPLIILSEVAVDMAGSLVFIYLTGNSLNLMSWIGIIIMTGIIINDSILKIDAINRSYARGRSIGRSVFEGGRKRFRPILLTSMTTILALLPVLVSPGEGQALQKPLAAAVIGGLITGTFVSLFFIPLAFQWQKSWLKQKNISPLK